MTSPNASSPGGARTTRVLCLGNELVHDDGVAMLVGRALREVELPDNVSIELRGVLGIELLDELRGDEALIIVDASWTGRLPGSCEVLELGQAIDLAVSPMGCHAVGVAEVLQTAARVAPERLPPKVVIVTIEAAVLEGIEVNLSAPVREAIPAAVDAVLETIGVSEELRRQGAEAAARWKDHVPSVAEIVGA